MTFWIIKQIKKVLKQLNSSESPESLSKGIVIGFFIGLAPFNILYALILFTVLFMLKVNIPFAFLSILLFSMVGLFVDVLAHYIGYVLLVDIKILAPIWTFLINVPILPYLKLNNTVMLGSVVLASLGAYPLYLGSKKLIIYYRLSWMEKIQKSKWMKLLKASRFLGWFFRYFNG